MTQSTWHYLRLDVPLALPEAPASEARGFLDPEDDSGLREAAAAAEALFRLRSLRSFSFLAERQPPGYTIGVGLGVEADDDVNAGEDDEATVEAQDERLPVRLGEWSTDFGD